MAIYLFSLLRCLLPFVIVNEIRDYRSASPSTRRNRVSQRILSEPDTYVGALESSLASGDMEYNQAVDPEAVHEPPRELGSVKTFSFRLRYPADH